MVHAAPRERMNTWLATASMMCRQQVARSSLVAVMSGKVSSSAPGRL